MPVLSTPRSASAAPLLTLATLALAAVGDATIYLSLALLIVRDGRISTLSMVENAIAAPPPILDQ
jgi:hypothetical protein